MRIPSIFTQRRRDFQSVFSTEEGKRVLAHIYKMCGMNRQVFSPGETEFNAGKHRIGQGIQSILAQDEASVMETLKGLRESEGSLTKAYDLYNN